MPTEIGGRKVVHSAALIVPKNERAEVVFSIDAWEIRLNIAFVVDERKADEPSRSPPLPTADIEQTGNIAHLTFRNWNVMGGVATTTPWAIGKANDGSTVGLQAFVLYVGETARADLQFVAWKE